MGTFKEFLMEAGDGMPGTATGGTSLQRNRPGSQKVFSPPVNYGGDIRHHQQEELTWKNGIFSHIIHMHSAGGLIEKNGGFYLPIDVVQGVSDGRPWHEEAITELQNAGIFSKTLVPIDIEAILLAHPPRNTFDMTNLIRYNGHTYIPAQSVDDAEIESMRQQGWLTQVQKFMIPVRSYKVEVNNAKMALARLADYRRSLDTVYNTVAAVSEPTLKPGYNYVTR